jgi:hypothetical protein
MHHSQKTFLNHSTTNRLNLKVIGWKLINKGYVQILISIGHTFITLCGDP